MILAAMACSLGAFAANTNRSCLVCHGQQFFDAEAFSKSVHAKLDCADCHRGYDFSMHRAKPPEFSPKEKELIDSIGNRSSVPAAFAACGKCHESQRDDLLGSVHNNPKGPLCKDCHGSPHAITKVASQNERKQAFAARCLGCHERGKGEEYRDSVHGRLIALGSDKAPSCFNCHGSHEIQPVSSPDSNVNEKNKVATCAECHKGATVNFAATFTHVPATRITRPIPGYTVIFFSWLTSLVLTGLVLHVSLDFGAEARQRWRRRKKGAAAEEHAPEARTVVRFDKHQLVQHWVMIASCVLLVFTGWPLHGAHLTASKPLISAFGGVASGALIHRIAGVLMGISALYHLAYLTVLAIRNQPFLSMLPGPKDLKDLWGNIRYFFDKTQERPKFGRFMYAEKFDYWAVFWGVAIMFGTGLVRWFPVWFAKWMPASIIESCQIAHGDEATLAALALFVWHLYNVHLRPSVFPMSWVWIDGKIDVHTMKEEHGAEYEELQRKGKLP
ncbi:MAG TPA: cytochrome b/b6 domain-containing protein [Myxococcales bacterium]|nr:cytochrome b/b6 domain-containing protein [Myxococcales bacterium]